VAHQGHRLRHPQTIRQAPSKQLAVARRKKKAGTRKLLGGGNQRFQVVVIFADGVTKETDRGCITSNAAISFDQGRTAFCNRILQLAAAIMPVDFLANTIARLDI